MFLVYAIYLFSVSTVSRSSQYELRRIGHPHLRASCIEALHVPKEGCNVLLLLLQQQQHLYPHPPYPPPPPSSSSSFVASVIIDEMLKIEKFRYCFMFGILLLCEIPI